MRVLQRALGVLERAEHPVAVQLQLAAMGLGDLPERLAVAGELDRAALRSPAPTSSTRSILW